MLIFAFKLFITPLPIGAVMLAGSRPLVKPLGIAPTSLQANGAAVACSGLFYLIARRLNRPH